MFRLKLEKWKNGVDVYQFFIFLFFDLNKKNGKMVLILSFFNLFIFDSNKKNGFDVYLFFHFFIFDTNYKNGKMALVRVIPNMVF